MSLPEMSISGGLFILAILVLRAFTLHKLPKLTFVLLWSAALLRLLLPFSFPSVWSAYTILEKKSPSLSLSKVSEHFPSSLPTIQPSILPGCAPERQIFPSVSAWVFLLAAGTILCAAFFLFTYLRSVREFRTSLPVTEGFAATWLAAHPFRRSVSVRQSDRALSPLTYGIFRPVILLPKKLDWENETTLQYILIHEAVHIRRFDAALKLLMTAALCLHWFNPFVWLLYYFMNCDIELLCDEKTIIQCGKEHRAAYARTLLCMEEENSFTPICNHFSKNAIEIRIAAIVRGKKATLLAIFLAAVLAMGTTVTFATSSERSGLPATTGTFTTEDFDKLSALRFAGHENLTLPEFREKALSIIDTENFKNTLERFSQDDKFRQQKATDDTAWFLFNILIPFTNADLTSFNFKDFVQRDFAGYLPAYLEYWVQVDLTHPELVKVCDVYTLRKNLKEDATHSLQFLSLKELQSEDALDILSDELERTVEEYSTEDFRITLSTSYIPPAKREDIPPFATRKDYDSFFAALMTPDYSSLSSAEFRRRLNQWAEKNPEQWELLESEIKDYGNAPLTEKEYLFRDLTCKASLLENEAEKRVQEHGYFEKDPQIEESKEGGFESSQGYKIWYRVHYQYTYQMKNPEQVTVGERDRCLNGMRNGLSQFFDENKAEALLHMGKDKIVENMKAIASQNSTEHVTIQVTEGMVTWEHKERGYPKD